MKAHQNKKLLAKRRRKAASGRRPGLGRALEGTNEWPGVAVGGSGVAGERKRQASSDWTKFKVCRN